MSRKTCQVYDQLRFNKPRIFETVQHKKLSTDIFAHVVPHLRSFCNQTPNTLAVLTKASKGLDEEEGHA